MSNNEKLNHSYISKNNDYGTSSKNEDYIKKLFLFHKISLRLHLIHLIIGISYHIIIQTNLFNKEILQNTNDILPYQFLIPPNTIFNCILCFTYLITSIFTFITLLKIKILFFELFIEHYRHITEITSIWFLISIVSIVYILTTYLFFSSNLIAISFAGFTFYPIYICIIYYFSSWKNIKDALMDIASQVKIRKSNNRTKKMVLFFLFFSLMYFLSLFIIKFINYVK